MQQFQYREPLKLPSQTGKSAVGTIVIHLAVLLLLIMVSFSVPPPPENQEGIMVNFGTDETGFGDIEPSPPPGQPNQAPPQPVVKETVAARPKAAAKQSGEAPMISQDQDDAPEVKKADPDAAKKKLEKIEADKKRKQELEAERIRIKQEEDEKRRIEAEQQRQADIMNKTRNALTNARNSGTSSTSEGIAGGTGNQGDPRGSVDSKVRGVGGGTGTSGISYSLTGRNFQSLPKPNYDYQGEGKVAVEVTVDRSGKVTQAIAGVKGSTTLDEPLLRAAHDAAMNARFDEKPDAPLIQKGTIIYTFILK